MLGFRRKRRDKVSDTVQTYAELFRDDRTRKRIGRAAEHGFLARERAAKQLGLTGAAVRLASDPELQAHLRQLVRELDAAQKRLTRKRSHRVRNTMLLVVGGGGAAAVAFVPAVRERLGKVAEAVPTGGPGGPKRIEETIEVAVPVTTAYNQWTQFEDFPLFMEGVEHVKQLDDTNLHWVANISGKTVEWDAKILHQVPDQRIAWTSTDGRETRGTVNFEEAGDGRTVVRLTMEWTPAGPGEAIGSAAGLDRRRIKGDLERFKELIEARGQESGAWRGEVEAGGKTA